MIQQVEFALAAKHRGCHVVTREIIDRLPKPLPRLGCSISLSSTPPAH